MASDKPYAVFLSFNSRDREDVRQIADYLANVAHMRPWFDEWDLIPGENWVDGLYRGLQESATCAVFVGQSGEGPWQEQEVRTALIQRVKEKSFRIIPVLLPVAPPQTPELPPFLGMMMWVDFRQKAILEDAALWRLECGILGKAPGKGRPTSGTGQTQPPISAAPSSAAAHNGAMSPIPASQRSSPFSHRVVEWLATLDIVQDKDGRRMLITQANLDRELANQINVDLMPGPFCTLAISTAISYGTLHTTGLPAVAALLLSARASVGLEKRAACDALLRELGVTPPADPPPVAAPRSPTLAERKRAQAQQRLAMLYQQLDAVHNQILGCVDDAQKAPLTHKRSQLEQEIEAAEREAQ